MPRGRRGKDGVMSAEASLREYIEDMATSSPESQQHRIGEGAHASLDCLFAWFDQGCDE
jgi:hypothetical protein